jgi:hypothetical protein
MRHITKFLAYELFTIPCRNLKLQLSIERSIYHNIIPLYLLFMALVSHRGCKKMWLGLRGSSLLARESRHCTTLYRLRAYLRDGTFCFGIMSGDSQKSTVVVISIGGIVLDHLAEVEIIKT